MRTGLGEPAALSFRGRGLSQRAPSGQRPRSLFPFGQHLPDGYWSPVLSTAGTGGTGPAHSKSSVLSPKALPRGPRGRGCLPRGVGNHEEINHRRRLSRRISECGLTAAFASVFPSFLSQ